MVAPASAADAHVIGQLGLAQAVQVEVALGQRSTETVMLKLGLAHRTGMHSALHWKYNAKIP